MLTGDIRNQIDRIWDAFWSGGIANPVDVIEQITYLLDTVGNTHAFGAPAPCGTPWGAAR